MNLFGCVSLTLICLAVAIPIIIFEVAKLKDGVSVFTPRLPNDTGYLATYYLNDYRSIEDIYEYIKKLTKSYSFFCKLIAIGHTSNKENLSGLPIFSLKITTGFPKPIVLVVSGINANDWKSVTSTLYVINQLLTNCTASASILSVYDWHFVPVLNPDGYRYSQNKPIARYWIKNMAHWNSDFVGVNLNRNFDYHWELKFNFYENSFPGLMAFSEEESIILRNYVLSIRSRLTMVILLRAPNEEAPQRPAILYPWSYTNLKVANWTALYYLGTAGSNSAAKHRGVAYAVVQSGSQESNLTGQIDDWFLGRIGVDYVFTIQNSFAPDMTKNLHQTVLDLGKEIFLIIRAMTLKAYKLYKYNEVDVSVDY